jgi:hypothetical protein
MKFDDWLLALHLLSAFALVGALTMFSIGVFALRAAETPRRVLALQPAMRVASVAVLVGVAGTIVFGIWLAIALDAYQVWDLWVILALVGWAAATETGRRSGVAFGAAVTRAETLVTEGRNEPDAELKALAGNRQAANLHWISTVITLLVLADMIWKPGA